MITQAHLLPSAERQNKTRAKLFLQAKMKSYNVNKRLYLNK